MTDADGLGMSKGRDPCAHQWGAADLDIGDGDAKDECAKCGALRYVSDQAKDGSTD